LKASCIEEIAYKRGFIDKDALISLAEPIRNSQYGKYLLRIASEEINVI
jgi:glucose-1-phosphate thymidylyltransferase